MDHQPLSNIYQLGHTSKIILPYGYPLGFDPSFPTPVGFKVHDLSLVQLLQLITDLQPQFHHRFKTWKIYHWLVVGPPL